ncbi:MAG: FecR domain-containing protein [Pseudomonadota bacterium]
MTDSDDVGPEDRQKQSAAIEDEAQDWLLRFLDGDPPEQDLDRFHRWYDADDRHGRAFEDLKALWGDLGKIGPGALLQGAQDGGARTRPARDPRHLPRRTQAKQARRGWRAAGMALAAVACVAAVLVFAPALQLQLTADFLTKAGEQDSVTLPDASVVTLNTDSAIQLRFTEQSREVVLLQGEAIFDVAKDTARPFSVVTGSTRATALGTIFAVRAGELGTTVTVTEGTVEVTAGPEGDPISASAASAILKPAQRITVDRVASDDMIEPSVAEDDLAWRGGHIVLNDLPFAEAVAEIDRYLPGNIVLVAGDRALGSVTARLSIDQIVDGLEALAATQGLSVTRVADLIFVIS